MSCLRSANEEPASPQASHTHTQTCAHIYSFRSSPSSRPSSVPMSHGCLQNRDGTKMCECGENTVTKVSHPPKQPQKHGANRTIGHSHSPSHPHRQRMHKSLRASRSQSRCSSAMWPAKGPGAQRWGAFSYRATCSKGGQGCLPVSQYMGLLCSTTPARDRLALKGPPG